MSKKRILFTYPYMNIGGSTSALLGLLNNLDKDKFDIDLQLGRNEGELIDYVPKNVRLLPEATLHISKFSKKLRIVCSRWFLKGIWHSVKYTRKVGFFAQDLAYAKTVLCRKPEGHYDIAVGGLEGWANAYVNECVDADVKISWIHTDYRKMNLVPEADVWSLKKSNYVVCVSDILAEQLAEIMPEIGHKIVCLENVIPCDMIRRMSNEAIAETGDFDQSSFKILTVARVSFFQKRLDRVIPILRSLLDEGLRVSWYIVGDGPDIDKLRKMADEAGVSESLFLMGSKVNPYPYYRLCDLFVLTSDIEGKPITVSEALTLGIPVVVTNYESASRQVADGVNGIIAENSEQGLIDALKKVMSNQAFYQSLKQNAGMVRTDNSAEVMKQFSQMCSNKER